MQNVPSLTAELQRKITQLLVATHADADILARDFRRDQRPLELQVNITYAITAHD